MNTSGVDEPPEIAVASVARLVSVSVGADTSVTWIPGYCFSNALISTVRASLAPVPVSGLADQTMLPDVAEPVAELVGEATAVDEDPAAGELELPLRAPVPVVLLPLEPQAASASAPAAASAAATPPRRMKTMPCRLRDIRSSWDCRPTVGREFHFSLDDLGQLGRHLRERLRGGLPQAQRRLHRAGDDQAGLVVVGADRARLGGVDRLLEDRQVGELLAQAGVGVDLLPDRRGAPPGGEGGP